MRDTLIIGSSPANEDCAQVGTDDYGSRARKECSAFIELIRRKLGPEPEGASLRIKGQAHDFGTYYEVAVSYDDTNEKATNYAYKVESKAPMKWDAQAKVELGMWETRDIRTQAATKGQGKIRS